MQENRSHESNQAICPGERLPHVPHNGNTSEAVTKSFEAFLSFVLTVTIFGASIFTVIVSDIPDPAAVSPEPKFSKQTIRTFLAISWLLFAVALSLGAFSMSVYYAQREKAGQGFTEEQIRKLRPLGVLASSMLQILIIVAFLFLSLVLVAYAEVVGWVAVAFSAAAAFGSVGLMIYG
ncbi:hypothetical protein CCMA1212_005598 [Trichoderma ghanense]|uniref:PGG domain-containing protein n=1 Tax=Trichoderma ghanense TaxID=65468 RepID=A0ABY2H2Q9_9HYPO